MPELPEVETVAMQLAPLLSGQRIEQVRVFDTKLEGAGLETLAGYQIASVSRIGKQVAVTLTSEGSERILLIHLRMSGRLLWRSSDQKRTVTLPDQLVHQPSIAEKHVRLTVVCGGGSLDFVDPRRFGTCALYDPGGTMPTIGLDPLSRAFSVDALAELVREVRQPLKPWLLRQDRIVGIGNIYASEILHRSALSPFRPAGSLSKADIARLHSEIQATLRAAIEMCGTTFSDFQQSNGDAGGFQRFLTVYEREGEACRSCNRPILREVQVGRSTYHCATCQR